VAPRIRSASAARSSAVDARREHGELVAAEAGEGVARTEARSDPGRGGETDVTGAQQGSGRAEQAQHDPDRRPDRRLEDVRADPEPDVRLTRDLARGSEEGDLGVVRVPLALVLEHLERTALARPAQQLLDPLGARELARSSRRAAR
jgi:hypothetical protein